jgi:hypothetical protein
VIREQLQDDDDDDDGDGGGGNKSIVPVPSGTLVVCKSSPHFLVSANKIKITPAVLPTFFQCSSTP